MLKSLLLIFTLSANLALSADLSEIINSISAQCPKVNILIIKKSLIEMRGSNFCQGTFTSILLKECPQINCSTLTSINTNAGAVIGR
ncbi:MAG: hypothetical protein KBD76_00165 [Bacteriovorax sp.]|jgi:hypothetical protein|nr:hypothetical protein [Bacteriovorax sp.]